MLKIPKGHDRSLSRYSAIAGDVTDMRSETLRNATWLILSIVYPYLCYLMVVQQAFTVDLIAPTILGTITLLAQRSRETRTQRAVWLFVSGLVLANLVVAWLYDLRWTPYLLPASVLIIGALLRPAQLFLVSTLVALVLITLSHPYFARSWQIAELLRNLAALFLAAFVAWTSSRALYVALDRSWRSFVEARDQREQLRERQGRLNAALKALDEAADRLQRMNYALTRARQTADDLRELQQQFTANVSHELRTPLALITGFSEMIYLSPESYGCPLPQAYVGDVREIYRSSQHLLSLIDDILDLSQTRAGKMRLVRAEMSIQAVIAEAVEVIRPLVEAKGLVLETDVDPNLPLLYLDPTRIRQVLLNLLNNARRFADQGLISVSAKREGDLVRVTVADTGIGISYDDQQRIFHAYRQIDGSLSRRQGGVGLGLVISKDFVEMHGGTIWVESDGIPGRGSAFHFTLPISERHDMGRPSLRYTPHRRSAQIAREERMLLIHGGGAQGIELLQGRLDGYRMQYIEEEAELPQAIQELMPVAVLINVEPETQVECIARIQSGQAGWTTPTIICSLGQEQRLARALKVRAYLTKPIDRGALLHALDSLGDEVSELLIVDDDPGVVRLVTRILQTTPTRYHISRASNGREALEQIRNQKPDVILLDLLMPEMDGYQFLAKMQADDALAHVPVIVITSRVYSDVDGQKYRSRFLAIAHHHGMANDEALLYIQHTLDLIAEGLGATAQTDDAEPVSATQGIAAPPGAEVAKRVS